MNDRIGRNDLCPCGSGKKYKKCCGMKQVVSINHVIEREISSVQEDLLNFGLYHYREEITDAFKNLVDIIGEVTPSTVEMYAMVHAAWFSVFMELKNGGTVLDHFIKSEGKKISRPKVRQILESWREARTIAGTILQVEGNKIVFEDGFNGETGEAIQVNGSSDEGIGGFFMGILLPFDEKYVFYPAAFKLPHTEPAQAMSFIEDKAVQLGYEAPNEMLNDFFMEIMTDLPTVKFKVEPHQLDWEKPEYQEVAEVFSENMTANGEEASLIELGVMLWYQFCQRKQKDIPKPASYAAALHYIMGDLRSMNKRQTQKELASIYGVSAGTISTRYQDLRYVLHDELMEIFKERLADLEEERDILKKFNSFAAKETEKPNKKLGRKPTAKDKAKAQELIYQAHESEGKARYSLARQAMELDADNADAYNILAESAPYADEALELFKQGVQAGERVLGKAFFEENKGYFWGLAETRPYMRAKLGYANMLHTLGKNKEAAAEFEEMLVLNPMDNQGIRYELFPVYVELNMLKKAGELLKKYQDEETTHAIYNELLLELLGKGTTAKAERLLKKAKEQNKYVIDYITGKKRLPKQMPDYYGWGDQNEAIVYAISSMSAWQRIDGLKEWLAAKK